MFIKKLTKLNLFIVTILVFLITSSVWLIVSAVNESRATRHQHIPAPYHVYLTNEESIEKIYNYLQEFGLVLVDTDERFKVTVAPQVGDGSDGTVEHSVEIVLINTDKGINIAFVTSVWVAGSDHMLSGQIGRRDWLSFHIENAFQEEHGVEVDRIFFTLGRTAWSEEEREEHMEVIIQDLENQIQDFIDQLRNE